MLESCIYSGKFEGFDQGHFFYDFVKYLPLNWLVPQVSKIFHGALPGKLSSTLINL